MAAARRERDRRPGRLPKGKEREPKKRILVLCEGRVTEPGYLKGFVRINRSAVVEVEFAPEQGVPLTLVRAAADRKKKAKTQARRLGDPNVLYDAVWCVFDVDDHPMLAEARETADANGINLAVSNPCFELWLLLHFREQPGAQERIVVKNLLRVHVPGYDKTVDFATYEPGYDAAVERARRMDDVAAADREPHRNPTTGVYRLTESIRDPDAWFGH